MELVVKKENERLDKYIASVTDYSRELVTKMIQDNYILVNNKKEKGSYKVNVGDNITIKDGYIKQINAKPKKMDLNIHILIIKNV